MILIDNTVLSNYALTDRLCLLRAFCVGRGMTTDAVLSEFQAGAERNLFKETDISWVRQTKIRDRAERRLFQALRARLGAGEASCLAVAIRRKHNLLTDDMDAREVALREGVRLSGSVGVLVSLINRRRISLDEGNAALWELIAAGYFSPVESLDGLILNVLGSSRT